MEQATEAKEDFTLGKSSKHLDQVHGLRSETFGAPEDVGARTNNVP